MTQHQHVPAHWYESAMQSINEKDAEIERLSGIYEEALRKEGRDVAEIARLRDMIERLRALVKDLADDLESELKGHYDSTLQYPSERRRFERDMDSVYRARAALKDTTP